MELTQFRIVNAITHTAGTCTGCGEGGCMGNLHCPCEGCGCAPADPKDKQ